jgi:hypothetical protein
MAWNRFEWPGNDSQPFNLGVAHLLTSEAFDALLRIGDDAVS